MKVLYIARATLYKDPGGDTIQIVNTAMALEKLGVDVDIRLTNEHFTYGDYDLIHFFNIIRPADILAHIAKSKKPYVVSTIFVDYSEYEKTNRKGIYGLIFKVLSLDSIEYLKAIARSVVNGEAIGSKMYLFYGHRRSIRRIVKNAFALLPNSWSEYQRLSKHYNIERRCFVIPNAINPDLFQYKASPINREANLVLCVARIEGRKNQLNLIKALNHSKFRLVLIGSPSANQHNYYNECKSVAGSNIE
ncbi:MAG: glycosyltransferase family 1 protein, partial [Sphingobacteriales bacterium]